MRLSMRHRQWIYWISALLFGSGALWLICHYFVRIEGEFGPAPHPLESWALRVHGAAAMLALVVGFAAADPCAPRLAPAAQSAGSCSQAWCPHRVRLRAVLFAGEWRGYDQLHWGRFGCTGTAGVAYRFVVRRCPACVPARGAPAPGRLARADDGRTA
jgi:hypothetical protein